ncbi:hypothetical protein EBL89_15040 [Cereibacter sphaeroides]|uniref:hypothetical protein n=1 Tax=Cereibacter sphaeroides TaxID=1063 RepID=UPI000F53D76C|nr:hypothetical protein [Cereibacter sphaeroides]AZB56550.1 hypothetical protein EBL89_15040 [Cereibacter sphaeroides]AZB60813.1 hypothetical protein EBL88_14910 [Cereibacter sphaeroides]
MTEEKKHPDAVVRQLADLAAQHGYGLMAVELVSRTPVGVTAPRHIYGAPRPASEG